MNGEFRDLSIKINLVSICEDKLQNKGEKHVKITVNTVNHFKHLKHKNHLTVQLHMWKLCVL